MPTKVFSWSRRYKGLESCLGLFYFEYSKVPMIFSEQDENSVYFLRFEHTDTSATTVWTA